MRFNAQNTTNYAEINKLPELENEVLVDFVIAYRPVILNLFQSLGVSKQAAEEWSFEFCTDFFMKKKVETFKREKAKFRTWLKIVARNFLIDQLRKQGRHPAPVGGTDFQSKLLQVAVEDASATTNLNWNDSDTSILMASIKEKLGISEKAWRCYSARLSHAEIASELGITVDCSRVLRSRVKKKIDQALSKLGIEDLIPPQNE